MLELYLDTVNIEKVHRFSACLPIKGVTTNPTILAQAGIGVKQALSEVTQILGKNARFHVQVVSETVDDMVAEAKNINDLPYDIVIKIPASEQGFEAIKKLKQENIKTLATAIYSSQQGLLAALCGADYLAPYVNRMDTIGNDGVNVVAELQQLLRQQELDCKLLPASFKNTKQVLDVMKLGIGAITLPVDVMDQMVTHPALGSATDQFRLDWKSTFGSKLSYET
jgi:fructose-6-phosphate aldolase 1